MSQTRITTASSKPDETSDAIEEGGMLDVPLRRSDFLTGAGRLGIGALGLGALRRFRFGCVRRCRLVAGRSRR